ncbi:hypothetical protein GFS31_36790 [Leptolyngbya sp. BL0902]|nr:hypothetical protein GFS31_36790 [Leptolyngbya sp. BL0902]
MYQRLGDIYNKRYGQSPTALVDALNQKFPDAWQASKKGKPHSQKDLISDRTIRQFFNSTNQPRLSLVNLNYLCRLMLGRSYQDILDGTLSKERAEQARAYSPDFSGVMRTKEVRTDACIPSLEDWLPDYQNQVRRQHGFVRIPYMNKAKSLDSLYINAALSKDLRIRKKKTISQLLQEMEGKLESHYQILAAKDVLDESSKVMIWGRAGSGKTTLLKDLVCDSTFLTETIPVFISLAEYAKEIASGEGDLLIETIEKYMKRLLRKCTHTLSREAIEHYFVEGRFFIALDGLDEVPNQYVHQVEDKISHLAKTYPENHYVVTCRFGSDHSVPETFTEVEIADWSQAQIYGFVKKWFYESKEKEVARIFIQELESNAVISDVARNPLLLTLLCQLYEDGYEFPRDQAELIEDAVELYIRKWDSARRIRRDPDFEKKLSRQHRKDLFAEIAYISMIEDRPFWQRWDLEEETRHFIENIPGVTDATLEQDTMTILHALEAEHGLLVRVSKENYAFSHRSFQEFFAFLYIFSQYGQNTDAIQQFLEKYLLERRFKSVVIMLIDRQRDAESLLTFIHQKMQALVKKHPTVQEWLTWLEAVTREAEVPTAAWRACIATFDLETPMHFVANPAIDRIRAQRLAENLRSFNQKHNRITKTTPRIRLVSRLAVIYKLAMDRALGKTVDLEFLGKFDPIYQNFQAQLRNVFVDLIDLCDEAGLSELSDGLQVLLKDFPEETSSEQDWATWAKKLQKELQGHLNEGYGHPVTPEDEAAVDDYIYLAGLLTEAILGDARCPFSVRETLLESLFLPIPTEELVNENSSKV